MEDIQQQLAALRQRIARVDRKYANAAPPPRPPLRPDAKFIEELLSGEIVTTPLGQHFETEKLWEPHRRHGSVYISDLAELPEDLLHPLSAGAVASAHPSRWAFLDTETTGLAGGTGTYAFLVGVGSIDASGFRLRQFFMRDYGEEASLLHRLTEYLARFDVLITYNGKSYDQPLLETRFRMVRARPQLFRSITARRRRSSTGSPSTWRGSTSSSPTTASPTTNPCWKRASAWFARAIPSTACSTSICSSVRAASGNCAWKAAAWSIWKTVSSAWSGRAICP